jgi:hypothetical protein
MAFVRTNYLDLDAFPMHKDSRLELRLSSAQHDYIRLCASQMNMNISAYSRTVLLSKTGETQQFPLSKLVMQLGDLHLTLIDLQLRLDKDPDQESINQLNISLSELRERLTQIRTEVLSKL